MGSTNPGNASSDANKNETDPQITLIGEEGPCETKLKETSVSETANSHDPKLGRKEERRLTIRNGATTQLKKMLNKICFNAEGWSGIMCNDSYGTLHRLRYIMNQRPTAMKQQ